VIITCINCNKKFDIDSNLIPNMGRLLQCASCDHKWFFKNEVLENTENPIVKDIDNLNVDIFDQNNQLNKEKINQSDLQKKEVEVDVAEDLDKEIEIDINENTPLNTKRKKQKKFKILNVVIISIISFVAFIIIVDTFKDPIGQVVPNIEIILYNLYESIKDILLFIRDLT
jgi:predicted Zn finger-like uncharacterized protein